MVDNQDEIIAWMTYEDYEESLKLIDRVMKLRESWRKNRSSLTGKENAKKKPPTLNIIEEDDDFLTISLTLRDHRELLKIYKIIENSRKRARRFDGKTHKRPQHSLKQIPQINVINF